MVNIKLEGIDHLIQDLDPQIFKEVFRVSVNERLSASLTKTFPKIKRRFNVGIRKSSTDKYFVARTVDDATNKRSGYFKLWKIPKDGNTAEIVVKSSPINMSRFDLSPSLYPTPSTKITKKRTKANCDSGGMSRISRATEIIHVKILKKGGITTLRSTPQRAVFRATMKNGHQGIFFRERGDCTIKEMRSITPTSMFLQDNVDFAKTMREDWDKNAVKRFMHNLSRRQRKAWK